LVQIWDGRKRKTGGDEETKRDKRKEKEEQEKMSHKDKMKNKRVVAMLKSMFPFMPEDQLHTCLYSNLVKGFVCLFFQYLHMLGKYYSGRLYH
jgi:hypothetical protein